MPLPPHDVHPLPSRRALREAERAAAAASSAPSPGAPARAARPASAAPVVPPPAGLVIDLREEAHEPADGHARPVVRPRAARAVGRVVAPRRAPAVVPRSVSEHVLEGGDDAWVAGVVPRPTPVASRAVVEDVPPAPATRDRGSAWRRLPQLLVVTALVAGTVAYARAEDTAATADEVRAYERAEQTVQPEAPSAALAVEEDVSAMVAGEDGLLRVRDEASRGGGRSVLPGCDGVPPETPQENGRIDESYLCALWDGTTEVRADAAVSLTLLNEQYRARFGTDMCLTDGYRSYEAQVSVRNRKPGLAARPGTSEHGFGLAVDLCGGVEGQGEGYWWLRENAAAFGWENPRWAQRGGGGPFEPWHWEYVAGQW